MFLFQISPPPSFSFRHDSSPNRSSGKCDCDVFRQYCTEVLLNAVGQRLNIGNDWDSRKGAGGYGCGRETQGLCDGSAKSFSPARNRHGAFDFSVLVSLLFSVWEWMNITMIARQLSEGITRTTEKLETTSSLIDILLQLVADQ